MRILFLIRSLSYGGAQRQVVALANGLASRGHTIAIIVFYPGGELEGHLNARVPLYSLEKGDRWSILGFLIRLIQLVRRQNPEIVYSFLAISNVIAVLLKVFFPRLRLVWGRRSGVRDASVYDLIERIVLLLERHIVRFADLIIYNSWQVRNASRDMGFPIRKSCVIPNGFDTQYFYPDLHARFRMRAEWKVPSEGKLIGIVGRFDPIKDHPTFLRAASLLLQSNRNVRFVCVGNGDGNYKRHLQALGDELGLRERMIWSGYLSDMPAVYNALDLLVSASLGEAFPNVIGEAMACGVPCVVTDVGDSARIAGDTSVVVPPEDPEALARGIEELLENLENIDRHRIRNHIIDNFSLDQLVVNTEKALGALLGS